MVPPSPGRTAAPERGAGARPAPPPHPPAPTGTAENTRTRANAPGRQTDRAWRRQGSMNRSRMRATPSMTRTTPVTPALLPAQGRQRDGTTQNDPPPLWPPRPHKRGTRRTGCPPPPPSQPPGTGTPRTRRPTPRGAHNPESGRGETGPGCPPPSTPNRARDRGRTRGGVRTARNGPTSAQRRDRASCARHTDQGGGGETGRRESASAHTHKGHAGNTRRATGPSSRNAQTAWNGVPASEGKGHPDGTARHTQRGTGGAGRGKRGRHDSRYRPEPPNWPRAPRTHSQGTAPAKAVVAHCAAAQPQG